MHAEDHIATGLRRLLFLALVLFLAASVYRAYSVVPVTVDGTHVTARRGTPLSKVVLEYSPARPGDLLSAKDRHVVRTGGGRKIMMLVNGEVPAGDSISPGDRVMAFSGDDVVEPVVVETRTVQARLQVIGTGPIARVLDPGKPGVQVVTVGAVSRDIVASETIAPPRPVIVRRVPAEGARAVALTFDDGPWPDQTEAVLSILDEKEVPATFFMLGLRVRASPALARKVVEAGHLVANHSYNHAYLDLADAALVRREIEGTNKVIARATGVTPRWFRAPAGRADGEVYAELKRAKMRAALWTVDPQDWRSGTKAAAIVANVKANVGPGAVILLHDGGGDQSETIKALPAIIDALRAQGYEFVTLDEMANVRATW